MSRESVNAKIDTDITNKTAEASVTAADVGNNMKDVNNRIEEAIIDQRQNNLMPSSVKSPTVDAVLAGLDSVALPYKSYVALITQSGTSAPTVKVLENTLGATISFSRTSPGIYVLTASSSVLTTDKTSVNYTYSPRQYQTAIMEVFGRTTSTITLRTSDLDVEATPPQYNTADCPFTDMFFEIRVYN